MAHGEWCLRPGEWLNTNEYLRSKNGPFYAVMQSDANFVIYRGDWWESDENTAMWDLLSRVTDYPAYRGILADRKVKIPGSFCAGMLTGGNFIVCKDVDRPKVSGANSFVLWYTVTYDPQGKLWAVMQDDGNFSLKRNGDINASPAFFTGVADSLDETNIQFAEMVYDFKNAIIKARGGPKLAVSSTAINGTEINQSSTLTISYTESTASGWKTSTTLKIGAKASMKVGVPTVAEGTVEVSSEIAQGWEWNVTTTKSEARTYSLPVVVPRGKGVVGRLTWSESTITLPFRLKGMGTFASGKKAPISINGIYEVVATHDLHAKWVPYKEKEEASARAMLMAAPSSVLP